MSLPSPGLPLKIALLGGAAAGLPAVLERALHGLLQAPPSRPLQWLRDTDLAHADLRWLLAWDDSAPAEESLAQLQAHNRLRQQLHAQGLPYQVLRGTLDEQILQALQSLSAGLPELAGRLPQTGTSSRRPGAWTCESCSDPDCEHRSFTALLAQRGQG